MKLLENVLYENREKMQKEEDSGVRTQDFRCTSKQLVHNGAEGQKAPCGTSLRKDNGTEHIDGLVGLTFMRSFKIFKKRSDKVMAGP